MLQILLSVLKRMVLNCLWLYFITSPAVAVSVSGYVFYLFEMLPLVVFYILASINPSFCC